MKNHMNYSIALMGLLLLSACNGGDGGNQGHKQNPQNKTTDTMTEEVKPHAPEIKKYTIDDALQCLKKTNLEVVAYQNMITACQIMHPEIEDVAEANGVLNDLAIKYFQLANPKPESLATFKNILKSMVLEGTQAIDSAGTSAVIQQIAHNQLLVQTVVQNNPALVSMEESFNSISFEWSFFTMGEIGADTEMLLNVAIEMNDPFAKSFQSIVLKLAQDPTNYQAIRALNYAHAIADKSEFKATALKALELALAKNDSSVEKKLDQAFQKEVTLEQMNTWIKLLER
jgi:hypothetical protein